MVPIEVEFYHRDCQGDVAFIVSFSSTSLLFHFWNIPLFYNFSIAIGIVSLIDCQHYCFSFFNHLHYFFIFKCLFIFSNFNFIFFNRLAFVSFSSIVAFFCILQWSKNSRRWQGLNPGLLSGRQTMPLPLLFSFDIINCNKVCPIHPAIACKHLLRELSIQGGKRMAPHL